MRSKLWTLAICVCATWMMLGDSAVTTAENNSGNRKSTPEYQRVEAEVKYLASDELEGRGPGTKGIEIAAEYIRDEFRKAGYKSGVEDGSFYQNFQISLGQQIDKEKTMLVLSGPENSKQTLKLGKDFQAMSAGGSGEAKSELVFVGYGISAPNLKYDEFQDIDVEGKIVVMIRREPQQDSDDSVFDGKQVSAHSYIRTKILRAFEKKAAGVFLVNDVRTTKEAGEDTLAPTNGFGGLSKKLPFAHVKQSILNAILKETPIKTKDGQSLGTLDAITKHIDETLQPVSQPLAGWSAKFQSSFANQETTVRNVVAVLEGKGPLADQTVIIGGHYDHLGYGGFGSRRPGVRAVHNGADDNATGTSAVLELARRFAKLKEPLPRRLVFIAFTAEERGLLGAKYYVENPLFELDSTTVMINFDMIGNVRDNKLLVFGVGTAKEFAPLIDPSAKGTGLEIDQKSGIAAASDHWPFFQKKIPSFHLFSGMTDIYHTPEDDFETLNIEGVVQAVEFTEQLTLAIAKLPEQTHFVQTGRQSIGRSQRGVSNYGFVPDYAAKVEGVKIASVRPNSPAEKGGLKAGDVVVTIGKTDIKNPAEMIQSLRGTDRSKPVTLKVKRADKTLEIKLTPPTNTTKRRGKKKP